MTRSRTAQICKWAADERTHVCDYCGLPNRISGGTIREHIVPLSRGGFDGFPNTACACRSCNTLKGSMTLIEWRQVIEARSGNPCQFHFETQEYQSLCAIYEMPAPLLHGRYSADAIARLERPWFTLFERPDWRKSNVLWRLAEGY